MSSLPHRFARLGAYTIEREIGRGGMATVYEAVHAELGRRVAIKVLNEATADRPVAMARLTREARLVARLNHPHIVTAIDFGRWEGRPYLVMERLTGSTLAAHRNERGRLPLAELIEIFLPLASAVAAAHANGIVHRDLKPSNVMLARRGGSSFHPTVLDFGISSGDDGQDADLTSTGAIIGTVSYLAPEQARGARYATAQSDQYALGVMLYECATGELPFRGEGSYETLHAIVTSDVRPPSEVVPALPCELDEVVARAMHRDPARRYPSVRALGRALLAFANERSLALWRDEFESPQSENERLISAPDGPPEPTLTEDPVLAERSQSVGAAAIAVSATRVRWSIVAAASIGTAAVLGVFGLSAARDGVPPPGRASATSATGVPVPSPSSVPLASGAAEAAVDADAPLASAAPPSAAAAAAPPLPSNAPRPPRRSRPTAAGTASARALAPGPRDAPILDPE